MTRTHARLWRRLAALAIGVLLALLVVEVLVRVFWAPPAGGYPDGLFVTDDEIGFALAPGFHARHQTPDFVVDLAIDAQGFRSHGPSRPRPAGGLQVLALGDSFGFGHGVEAADAYPAQLEVLLAAQGTAAEVVNAGAPGYGTRNELALLRRIDRAAAAKTGGLDPDLVIVGFYLGNDFRDNHHRRFGTLVARSGMLVPQNDGDGGLPWELKAFALLNWRTLQALVLGLGAKAGGSEAERVQAHCAGLAWDPGFGAAMTRVVWEDDARAAFDATTALLDELAGECAAHQRKLLLVLLPAPFQYNPALWQIVLSQCSLAGGDYDMAKPSRLLLEWAERRGVACLDLLPAFRQATEAGAGQLYGDVHFNRAGHLLAAQQLVQHLAEARIPAPARAR